MPEPQAYLPHEFVTALYRGLLGREPDKEGFASNVNALSNGVSPVDLIKSFVASQEFKGKEIIIPKRTDVFLPDLTKIFPDRYSRTGEDLSVFFARSEEDFAWIENMIISHRYYDSGEVYSPLIDLDKRITAAMVMSLGAESCIELGCFTGSVLSVLADNGVEICGVDASHLAFVLAYGNVRKYLKFGDLLDQSFDRKFDVFAGMDILEHLDPARIDQYVQKVSELLNPRGFMLINSPMFGRDRIFGEVFHQYFPEWIDAGEEQYWRHVHCDAKGWPVHGHLINASPKWWESMFLRNGFVRNVEIELKIQGRLEKYFVGSPARKSLFVLHREGMVCDSSEIDERLDSYLSPLLQELEHI